MHRDFRKRLDGAKGVSEFVIALNLDIRGFSKWSLEVDSAQTALFIKKVYAKLIDQYFAEAAFFKPTGDGLLVIFNFDEERVGEAVREVVENARQIVVEFERLCADEPAVNFPVPPNVGIGISRGAASRLLSGRYTLDYSGRVLNLASRLMDVARPKGIVFDSRLGVELLTPEVRNSFTPHHVYLPGVAPREPIEVQCWPEVEIPLPYLSPVGQPQWEHVEHEAPRKDFDGIEHFQLDLPNHPPDPSTLRCQVVHDQVTPTGRRSTSYVRTFTIPVEYVDAGGQAEAWFQLRDLQEELDEGGVKGTWPVTVKVSYRVS